MPRENDLSATETLDTEVPGDPEATHGTTAQSGELPEPRPGRLGFLLEGACLYAFLQLLTLPMLLPLRIGEDTFFGDVLIGWFGPEKHGTSALLADGFLPTWVRSQFGGEPYIANIQHAVFYPGNIPFWVLPTSTALKIVIATHLAFAGVAMWAYCRFALRSGRWGAVVAALGFGLGGVMMAHIGLMNQLQVIAWMPLVLLGGHLALEGGRLRHVVFAAVCIGLQLLAGHPEEWVYTLYALALYGVVWALARDWPGWSAWWRRTLGGMIRLGGSVALFALLFGFQLYPTLLLQGEGWRNAPDFNQQYELPVHMTVNSLLPDYGTVLIGENVGFIGVAGLLLAALGVVAGRRELRWVRVWLGVLALLGLSMAVGMRSPLYAFLYHNIDLVSQFRVPSRWLQLTYFALAAGAALGTDVLLRKGVRMVRRLRDAALAGGALVVLFGLAALLGNATPPGDSILWWALAAGATGVAWLAASFPAVPRIAVALLLVVTASAEVARARQQAEFNQSVPGVVYDDPGPLLRRIAEEGGRYVSVADVPVTPQERAMVPVPDGLDGRQTNYYLVSYTRQLIGRPALQYMTHAETITGRDGGLMPTQPYTEFIDATIGAKGQFTAGIMLQPPSRWNFATLDYLGVRWFVTPGLPPAEAQILEQHGFQISDRVGHVLLWKRDQPPLARMHYAVDVIPDADERLRRLREGYPLDQRAIVEEEVGTFTPPTTPPSVTTTTDHDRVDVQVTTETEGLLVLADPWYPMWEVQVDGEPAELVRANHGFRGVVVPAGEHEVTFVFKATAMKAGFLVAGLTVLGLAVTGFIGRRRRRAGQAAGI